MFASWSYGATPAIYLQPQEWEVKSFSGFTRYSFSTSEDETVVQAISEGSASSLYLEKDIDIRRFSWLSWRWRTQDVFEGLDEKTRAGDDFPVRVYVVVSDGIFPWQVKSLVYVWSASQPIDSRWLNPYTDKAVMWVLDSGDRYIGQWREQKRNVREDLYRAFGQYYDEIKGIAIMTDSDSSGIHTMSWYSGFKLQQ